MDKCPGSSRTNIKTLTFVRVSTFSVRGSRYKRFDRKPRAIPEVVVPRARPFYSLPHHLCHTVVIPRAFANLYTHTFRYTSELACYPLGKLRARGRTKSLANRPFKIQNRRLKRKFSPSSPDQTGQVFRRWSGGTIVDIKTLSVTEND